MSDIGTPIVGGTASHVGTQFGPDLRTCPVCGRAFGSMKAIGGHVSQRPECRLPGEAKRQRTIAVERARRRELGVKERTYQEFAAIQYPTLAERFHEKVERGEPDACWPWNGVRTTKGYGQLWFERKHRPATHIALALDGRPVRPGAVVMHSCDNPPCVNPAHLSIGTQSDNLQDMLAKGRGRWQR